MGNAKIVFWRTIVGFFVGFFILLIIPLLLKPPQRVGAQVYPCSNAGEICDNTYYFCCLGELCNTKTNKCYNCGDAGQPCCNGSCTDGYSVCNINGICASCGTLGAACCGSGTCSAGHCWDGTCYNTIYCDWVNDCGANGCSSNKATISYYACPDWVSCLARPQLIGNCDPNGNSPCIVPVNGCSTCAVTWCNNVTLTNGQCPPNGYAHYDSCTDFSQPDPYDCGWCPGTGPNPTGTILPTTTPVPNGTIRARAVLVTGTPSCADVNDPNATPLTDTINLSPDSGAEVATGGLYATWSVQPQTYTVMPNDIPGYTPKLDCWTIDSPAAEGSGPTKAVQSNQTLTWNLGYTVTGPWFQSGGGGDVYGATTIRSYIPPAASPRYFALDGAGGTPGVVTYGVNYDFDSTSGKGEAYVSSTGWLVHETYAQTDFYQMFYHRFGSPSPTASGNTTLTSQLPGSPDPYYYDGNLTINGAGDAPPGVPWDIPSGQKVVVFVSGNLTIKTPITIQSGGFIAFIVNGTIFVDPSVGVPMGSSTPVLEGVYITSPTGTFDTGASSNAGTERFVGRGTFVAGSFTLRRNLLNVGGNNTTAGELFLYNPQLLLTMPDKMRDIPITWQEVAP